MKSLTYPILLLCAVAVAIASPAMAAPREDYAAGWPLALSEADAGAYRVVLDADVYRQATSAGLRDVDVVNADGVAVPAAVFAPDVPLARDTRRRPLPWFALPRGAAARAPDISVISERDADGRLRRVVTRMADTDAATAPAANAWLVDAGATHAPVSALRLAWAASEVPIDVAYRVEGSDNLRTWRVLQPHVQLVDLVRDGQRLRQARVPLDGRARYLRLLPAGEGATPVLTGVEAEVDTAVDPGDWQWHALTGRVVEEAGVRWHVYALDGRFPVTQADVGLAGNDAGEWTLQSRDDDSAPWVTRAGPWVAFRVGADTRSPAQPLGRVVRDRQWRLSSRTTVSGAPELRLGYRPEVLVFLAHGAPPYTLVAGSARAARGDAPLDALLGAIRSARGAAWQPAAATTGARVALAGNDALRPAPRARDWRAWLLWSLLVAGAAVVATMAISVVRKAGPPPPAE